MGGDYVLITEGVRPTSKARRLCFFWVLALTSVALFGFMFATNEGDNYVTHIMKMVGLSRSPEELRMYASEPCVLPNLDPLDASILPYVNPNYDPMKNCKPTFVPMTRVRNGRVEVVREFELAKHLTGCEFRCHYPQGDYQSRQGEWLKISLTPDCDVIEVHCRDASGKITYEYVHTQIFANRTSVGTPSLVPKNATNRPPDVHILVLDAVSSAQLMRSMPKSLRFLEEELGAINFRYLNKVGLSSRPNAYTMFLGRLHNASADIDEWALCKKALDNETFIVFEYQRRGYKTMMAEDQVGGGAFNWPSCKGFEKTHFDHYMRPFQILYRASKESEAWQKKLFDEQCRGQHLYLFDYFKNFLDAYADEPKFSIMWPVELAHDEVNGLYPVDDIFLKMLKDYKAKLNNAFLFVMGDHGIRFTGIRSTKQGEIEDHNPALIMTVPEHLRKNKQLMANLKANSKQLVTHYDNHATWVNIARECDKMTSDSPFARLNTSTWNVTLLGESYLYPFNLSKPRNCANLQVYSGFCICQNKAKNVTVEKQPLARRIATFLVGHINDFLKTKKAMDVCEELIMDANRTVELLKLNADVGMHRITFRTLPNDGKYEAHVKVSNEDDVGGVEAYSIVTNKITRLDTYEAQVKCMKDYETRPFCSCRTLRKS